MRTERRFLIGFIISAVVFIVYFAAQVSATYGPLKSYKYSLTKDELEERLIQTIKSNANLTYTLTDSTGPVKDLYYYAYVLIKVGTDEYKYNIKYYNKDSFWDSDVRSELSLIGAFDKIHRTGGYKTDNTDIEKLIGIFEEQVISELNVKNANR
jgi:hypothetical protein